MNDPPENSLSEVARVTGEHDERQSARRQRRRDRTRARPRQIGVHDRRFAPDGLNQAQRFADSGRHAGDLKTGVGKDGSQVLGDQRLVLDNQDAGSLRSFNRHFRLARTLVSRPSLTSALSFQIRPLSR